MRGDTAALHDILGCMEDIAASVVATLTAAPQLSRPLALKTDNSFLMTLSYWHDTLLPNLRHQNIGDPDRRLLDVLAGSCAWLACYVIGHGVLQITPAHRAINSDGLPPAAVSDELLPLLMDLKLVRCYDSLKAHCTVRYGDFGGVLTQL